MPVNVSWRNWANLFVQQLLDLRKQDFVGQVTINYCSYLKQKEVFTEMEEKYGEVEEMNVCDNLGDHLVGNVYVKVGARDGLFF